MKHTRTIHYVKVTILSVISVFMVLNSGEGFLTAMANDRKLIRDLPRYGSYYQKDLNTETVEPKSVVVGDREKVEREPELEKEVEDYDASQEILEKRTENTKTFQQEDGTRVTKQYFEPIHKKVSGEWVDIDDTLKQQTSLFRADTNEFENEEGILAVTFNTDKVQVERDIEIIPDGDLSSFAVKENAVLYNQVLDQVDIQYAVRSNHLFQEAKLYNKDTLSVSYLMKTDAKVEEKDGNLHIYADEEYVISTPILKDRDGKTSLNTEVAISEEEDAYRITYTMDAAFMEAEDTAYPVSVTNGLTRASTVSMDTSYIRSGSPNTTSAYNHLMVGYDKNGTVSGIGNPNIIGIARSFFSFDMPRLEANRRLVSASLMLYKFNDFGDAEVPQISVYDTNGRINANTVTWNNQPSNLTFISSNFNLRGQSYKKFDITSAAKKMHGGTPTSIMLRAADESSSYYMLAFYSESTGSRPLIEIVDQPNYDINPDMELNSFHEYFRYYTAGYNQFKGISIDGIAKPNSKVNFDLYEKTNTNETKIKTTSTTSSLNKINPIFVNNPLAGVQKYTAGMTNYSSNYLTQSFFPKKDTLYNFHVSVEKDGSKSKELITDASMLYTVKLGDNLQTIATHYGLTVNDLQKYNNTNIKKVKEGDVLYINYPNENPYLSEDIYKPPTRVSVYMAEYKYRGPNCVGKCDVADPVSVSTGNFFHEVKDFTLSDYDDLFMQRTYNSVGDANASIFGAGFSSNLEQYLSYDKDDNILYYASSGKILKFLKNGSVYKDDQNFSITKNYDSYTVYNKDNGETMDFNGYGTLTSIKTKTGNVSTLSYDPYGKITGIKFGNKQINFEYYPKRNLVKSIILPNNAKVQYKYNSKNQLIEFIDALGNSETYNYNSNGKISSIKTLKGDTIAQNTYDSKGRVLTQRDGTGKLTKFTYTGRDVIVEYEGGEKKTYSYTEDYNISAITNSDNSGDKYEYENGALTPETETDGEGRKTNYFYDDKQQLIKTVYPDETFETYTYDDRGNVIEHRTRDGKVESFSFSNRNLMVNKVDVNGVTTIFLHDHATNKLVTELDLTYNTITEYEYEGNQISKKKTSKGLETNYIYDSIGNVIKEYDNNGRSTEYTYDKKNQILSKKDAFGNTETYAYDGNGNVIQYVDKLGAKTVNTYDGNNNLIQTTRGTLTTKKTYDALNRVISETDEQGLTKTYEYNPAGHLSKETDIYGKVTTYTYDKAGHQISKTDAKGNTTTYVYDINNLVSETDALGNTTTYAYDDLGRMISTTKPNGKTETTEYNEFGNVISKTNERGVVSTNTYDSRQRLKSGKNDKGESFSYSYDTYDRITEKSEGSVRIKYTYDIYDNEISQVNSLGHTSTKTYDALNRVVSETDGMGGTITHAYDAEDNEIKTIDQNGNATKSVYDIYGFKLQDIDALGNATTYTYNNKGLLATTTDAKGVKTTHSYDAFNHEISRVVNGVTVSSSKYDAYGRLIEEKTPSEGKAYVYDAYDRVIEERNLVTGLITKKTYDRFSNVTEESDNGGHIFTREYTAFQELAETVDALGRIETTSYDEYGRKLLCKGFDNKITLYTYDYYGNNIMQTDALFNRTSMTYDAMHQLLTSTSPQGVTTTYTYDKAGRQISATDSFTNKSTYTKYDAVGNVIETIDQNGALTKNTYDAKNQLIEVNDALENVTSYEYDALGNLIKTTDAVGCSKQSEYNAFGLISKEVDERWFVTIYEYNDKLLVSKIIDKNENESTKIYDEHNRLKEEKDQNGDVTHYTYDINGNITKKIDPNGNITTTKYDILGNVLEERVPNKTTINTYNKYGYLLTSKENNVVMQRNTYDIYNQLTKTLDALSRSIVNTYDEYGNLIKENKEGYITEKSYDKLGRLIKTIENTDKITNYEYDAMGRETKQTQNDKVIKASGYDAMGNVVEAYENGITKHFTYDGMNRVEKTIYPSAPDVYDIEFMNAYDETGNLVIEVDPYGNMKTREYSPMGEIVSETDENEHITRFAYDGVGNLTKVQNALDRIVEFEYDGNRNQTVKYINDRKATYTYDANNHLTKEKNEYNKEENYRYDVNGKLLEHVRPDGTKITYTYDALGNKLSEGERRFTYDKQNNLKTASIGGSSITYVYDKYNRMQSVQQPNVNLITYEWDIYGNKTSIIYGDKRLDYQYNDMNKVTKVNYNGKQMASYAYDARGNVTTLVNGRFQTDYTYDKLNRKTEYNTFERLEERNYQYTYDPAGNMLSETINGKTNTYTYDEMNELKSSTKNINGEKVTTEYGYDLYGNKTEASTNGEFKRYHYNQNNELTNIYTKEGNTDIYYDRNGNIRDILYAGGGKDNYQYDEYGQLINVSNTKSEWYSFSYDADGDRSNVTRMVGQNFDRENWYQSLSELTLEEATALLDDKKGEQTFEAMRYQATYLEENGTCAIMQDSSDDFNKYIANQIVDKTQEYSEVLATNIDDFHIYGEGERLYSEARNENRNINEITYVNGNNNAVYLEFVQERGTNVISPANYKDIEYDDYGYTDDINKGFGYNGEALDETGLIYLRARYYNPKIGQFIQADRYAGEQKDIESQNRYAFVKQNPYKYVDKDGRLAIQISDRPGKGNENSGNYWTERKKQEQIKKKAQVAVQEVLEVQKINAANKNNGSNGNKGSSPSKATVSGDNQEVEKPKPKPKCISFTELWKSLVDKGQDMINNVKSFFEGAGAFVIQQGKNFLSCVDGILDSAARVTSVIVFVAGCVAMGTSLAATLPMLAGATILGASIGAIASTASGLTMITGTVAIGMGGAQILSGGLGYRLDGRKLSKEEAQTRIANGETNLGIAGLGVALGHLSTYVPEGASGAKSWYKKDGTINYPPNNGAVVGTEKTISLKPGDTLGRYGNIGEKSNFVTQTGADASKLSLPPTTDPKMYQEFVVVKEIPQTIQAKIAAWGDSVGGGLQYELPMPIQKLIREGYIVPK